MKICILTTSFPRYKGDFAGSFLFDQANELIKQGVDVSVLAPHYNGIPKKEVVSNIKINRFVYMFPRSLEKVSYGEGIVGNLKKIWVLLELPFFISFFILEGIKLSRKVDLFHAQWAQTAIVARLIKIFTGKKYLVTVLGSDSDVCTKTRFLKSLTEWGLNGAEWIIAGNKYLEDELKKLNLKEGKIIKINMGVGGIESLLRISEKSNSKKFIFLGRISPEKNLELVIQSLADVKVVGDFKLIVVGDGPLRKDME